MRPTMPSSPAPDSLLRGLLLIIFSIFSWSHSPDNTDIPVVYVVYGKIPDFLLINIELASRNNDVVVISDDHTVFVDNHHLGYNFSVGHTSAVHQSNLRKSHLGNQSHTNSRVHFQDIRLYSSSAEDFGKHYKHLSPDHSHNRMKHELRCFQRWFVLQDYMMKNDIARSFFGDGDSTVFMNIKSAVRFREHCSAIINIDAQQHDLYWCAAGEASVWTVAAIVDFCSFTVEVYKTKLETLKIKSDKMTSVVDMSLLWLWWVSHQNVTSADWSTGRPYLSRNPKDDINQLAIYRKQSDDAFLFSKKLPLPISNSSNLALKASLSPVLKKQLSSSSPLEICNGMDVVNRTVFDHIGGWRSGKKQSLNVHGEGDMIGIPYVIGESLVDGGRPESLEEKELSILKESKLYFVNFHYQGSNKYLIQYDVCRILLQTGSKTIHDPTVLRICNQELKKPRIRSPGSESGSGSEGCQNHESLVEGVEICI